MTLKKPIVLALAWLALGVTAQAAENISGADSSRARAPWHSLLVKPDPQLAPHIHFYDKLNPAWWVRNLAEPVAPSWYKPGDPRRNLKYHVRNPGSNFCRYVIGIADKEFVRSGRHPEVPANPHGGLNFAISRRGLVVLPFIDYRFRKFEIYFGWRNNGSFGVACRKQPLLAGK